MFPADIPVSVIVTTKNEARRIASCIDVLKNFSEIIVVDSQSVDGTGDIARAHGARVVDFTWNRHYPKKRQWCLDNLEIKHDWIFFVDADEIVTPDLYREIAALFASGPPACDGYFIRGLYTSDGKVLRRGLQNSKLVLFDKKRFCFPVVDDLDLPGMGEMEGHYQPVGKDGASVKIGRLKNHVLHLTEIDGSAWEARHRRYAQWEASMNRRGAWPQDPVPWRQFLKSLFRTPLKATHRFHPFLYSEHGIFRRKTRLASCAQPGPLLSDDRRRNAEAELTATILWRLAAARIFLAVRRAAAGISCLVCLLLRAATAG